MKRMSRICVVKGPRLLASRIRHGAALTTLNDMFFVQMPSHPSAHKVAWAVESMLHISQGANAEVLTEHSKRCAHAIAACAKEEISTPQRRLKGALPKLPSILCAADMRRILSLGEFSIPQRLDDRSRLELSIDDAEGAGKGIAEAGAFQRLRCTPRRCAKRTSLLLPSMLPVAETQRIVRGQSV